ncbi:transcriptional regulator [Bifidobacterium choloepi]|uniref:Transcriptional regulator n=1 Tax=Bifidobacterium choloepi TaxID=2614131 RepID=A0A6I5MXZ9_9BIFI|nr:transcriptional regulator [Bifidobacterium choloepi]NEG69056.1 transcriptional regulator [Bifidobacterium choloepi]
MSEHTLNRHALAILDAEPTAERIDHYRKPFMVLWAAVQEASAEIMDEYGLSQDLAQLWVAEQLRQVTDSLVDRLAEKALQHGASKSNVARAAGASPANATRRFPRLKENHPAGRTLIDDVLDELE